MTNQSNFNCGSVIQIPHSAKIIVLDVWCVHMCDTVQLEEFENYKLWNFW